MGLDGSGSGALITPETYSLDFIRPVISSVKATTDKPTLGIIAAGSNKSAGTTYPYNLWTLPEDDNAGVYRTAHDGYDHKSAGSADAFLCSRKGRGGQLGAVARRGGVVAAQ
jgi:hypothetical protein